MPFPEITYNPETIGSTSTDNKDRHRAKSCLDSEPESVSPQTSKLIELVSLLKPENIPDNIGADWDFGNEATLDSLPHSTKVYPLAPAILRPGRKRHSKPKSVRFVDSEPEYIPNTGRDWHAENKLPPIFLNIAEYETPQDTCSAECPVENQRGAEKELASQQQPDPPRTADLGANNASSSPKLQSTPICVYEDSDIVADGTLQVNDSAQCPETDLLSDDKESVSSDEPVPPQMTGNTSTPSSGNIDQRRRALQAAKRFLERAPNFRPRNFVHFLDRFGKALYEIPDAGISESWLLRNLPEKKGKKISGTTNNTPRNTSRNTPRNTGSLPYDYFINRRFLRTPKPGILRIDHEKTEDEYAQNRGSLMVMRRRPLPPPIVLEANSKIDCATTGCISDAAAGTPEYNNLLKNSNVCDEYLESVPASRSGKQAAPHKNTVAKGKAREYCSQRGSDEDTPDGNNDKTFDQKNETDGYVLGRLAIDESLLLEKLMQKFIDNANDDFGPDKAQLLESKDQYIGPHPDPSGTSCTETSLQMLGTTRNTMLENICSYRSMDETYPILNTNLNRQLILTEAPSLNISHAPACPSVIRVCTPRAGWFNRHKIMVERLCDLPIIWWPLAAPVYPGTKSVSFRCGCGKTITEIVPDEQIESTSAFFQELHVHYSTVATSNQLSNTQFNGSTQSQQAGTAIPMTNMVASSSSPSHRGLNPNSNIVNIQVPGPHGTAAPEPAAYVLFYQTSTLKCIDLPSSQQRSDKAFFNLLRSTYYKQRGSLRNLFSVKTIKALEFTKFQRIYQYIESIYEEYCDPPKNAGYTYQPDNSQRPIISPRAMMHFFHHPHHAAGGFPVQYLITQIPKRLDGPKPNEEHFTWGITATEGISCVRVIIWSLIVLLVGAIGGSVFVTWWLKRHPGDLQNAFIPIFGALAFVPVIFCVSQFLQSVKMLGREKKE